MASTASPLRRGLYLVTRELADTERLVAVVRDALDGGAVVVQYRDKSNDRGRRVEQARALAAICRGFDAPLVINDDVDLAIEVGAGVHLGRDDGAIPAARAALGAHAIVGASCYDTLDRAEPAVRDGASYLAFGSFFASPTKPHAPRAPLAVLDAARTFALPRVAIGGITLDNAASLVAAGADLLAVISAVFDAPEPRAAAAAFTALYSFDSDGNRR